MWSEGATVSKPLWNGLVPERLSSSSATSCALPPRFEAVRDARRFTRTTLHHWGLEGILDGVELVASELVTNALRYGVPDMAPNLPPEAPAEALCVSVLSDGPRAWSAPCGTPAATARLPGWPTTSPNQAADCTSWNPSVKPGDGTP